MAFVSQSDKAKLAPAIKAVCAKYGIKATLSVNNHSALNLNIRSGRIDLIKNMNEVCSKSPDANRYGPYRPTVGYIQVNEYHYERHFSGEALAFLSEVIPLMYGPDYYDHSDIQSDYFDCSHYIHVNIGAWNKHYEVTA